MRIDIHKANCCGCSACAEKCPKQAIRMLPDELGFLYPVIDEDKCVDCGLCVRVCVFHTQANKKSLPLVYAGRLTDQELLAKSQSGGAFWGLAHSIMANGGIVYGATFRDDFSVAHVRTTSFHDMEQLRGSKYIQSDMNQSYVSVKKDLSNGFTVLFTGTPCQIAGLYSYLGNKNIERLYTIDLVCHGVPSPWVWMDYINYIEKQKKTR